MKICTIKLFFLTVLCLIALVFGIFNIANADTVGGERGYLSLADAVQRAQKSANPIQASINQALAAKERVDSLYATQFPKLSLEGSFRNQSVVPRASIGPNRLKLTDYNTYSIGPTLSYVLWDSGQRRSLANSAQSMAEAKLAQSRLTEQQIALAVELAYLQAVLSNEITQFALQSVELSKAQNRDVQNKFQTGAVSRLDSLAAKNEVASFQLKAEQAISDFSLALKDLEFFVGPVPEGTRLDALDGLVKIISNNKLQSAPSLLQHHAYKVSSHLEMSALLQVEAQKSSFWPTLYLQLHSSLDYPNGPSFEQIQQNSFSLNLSWPLYEFGATRASVASARAEALSSFYQKEEALKTLRRDDEKARSKADSLQKQIEEAAEILKNQDDLAKLHFSTYKLGKLSFSEVQNANLRLLEAKNRLSQLRAQYLAQLFTLRYLEGEKGE